jgi:hypothetical protein
MPGSGFSLQGSGELLGIGFIVESEIYLGVPAIPCHGRCIVAGWLLLSYQAPENVQRNRQLVSVVRSGDLN